MPRIAFALVAVGLLLSLAADSGAADRSSKFAPRWGLGVGVYGRPGEARFGYQATFPPPDNINDFLKPFYPEDEQILDVNRGVCFGAFYDHPIGRIVRVGLGIDWYRVAWQYQNSYNELRQNDIYEFASELFMSLGLRVNVDLLSFHDRLALRPGGGLNYGRLPQIGIRYSGPLSQPYVLENSRYLAWQVDLELSWTFDPLGIAVHGGLIEATGSGGGAVLSEATEGDFDTSLSKGTWVRFVLFKPLD
jgi:hypothetical protein